MATSITIKHIHQDERGEIICFYLNGIEYTLLITKEGFARGGCLHNVTEYAVVLEGKVKYKMPKISEKYIVGQKEPVTVDETWQVIIPKGRTITVPPETPHLFISLTDSIVLEWGAPPDQKTRKHPESRALVETINLLRQRAELKPKTLNITE